MSDITVTTKAQDSASRSLQVTVSVDRIRATETRAIQSYTKRVRVPGFRPGRAPEAVVRRRLQTEIRQYVLEDAIRAGWEEARSSQGLQPIGDPAVRNVRFEEGHPLEFELYVEVRPEIALNRTGGFRVTRSVEPVGETLVDERLQALREEQAAWLPVEGEKPAPGRLVRVEVAPIEADEVKPARPYSLVLGQGNAVPALEEAIMTLLPGETADTEIRVAEDHAEAAHRDQTRRVRVTLHEVKRQELPPLDDAFAAAVGAFTDLAALREGIRADLAREAEREADARLRESLLRQIVEANAISAPESLVHRLLHAMLEAYRIPHEQFETFAAQFRPAAETQVQRDLVLSAVAETQELRATEAELDTRIAEIAGQRGVPVGEVYASLEQAKRLPELERSITEEKVWTWLLAQSTVTEA